MANDLYILRHYKNIAEQYGLRSDATLRDQEIKSTEIDFLIAELMEFVLRYDRFPRVLDVGCGNGHTLAQLKSVFPEAQFEGCEFTPELYELAKSRGGAHIFHHDIRDPLPDTGYDFIFTERVIINLLSRKQQIKALKNISEALSYRGRYCMIESFDDSLHELNVLMNQNGFESIEPSRHNFFIRKGVFSQLKRMGLQEIEGQIPHNQLSTYFVLTRVLHPMLRQSHQKRLNNKLVDFFLSGLDSAAGNYSPIRMHVFELA